MCYHQAPPLERVVAQVGDAGQAKPHLEHNPLSLLGACHATPIRKLNDPDLFHVAVAQGEAIIEPDPMADDLAGKAVIFVACGISGWRHVWLPILRYVRGSRGSITGVSMSWVRKQGQQLDIYGPARAVKGLSRWTNTLRNRCRHISDLCVKERLALRALMKSALPLLNNALASQAVSSSGFGEAGLTYRVINSITPRIVRQDSSTSWCHPLAIFVKLLPGKSLTSVSSLTRLSSLSISLHGACSPL